MKRFVVALLVGLLAASLALPTEAVAKKKKGKKKVARVQRVVDWAYEAPAFGTPETPSLCLYATNSCIAIATGPQDKFIQMEMQDASGTPTAVWIGQDTDPEAFGTEEPIGLLCGKTDKPLPIQPGFEIVGFPLAFGGAACPGAVGTRGTAKVTLSNMP